ncbi:hypothetical protein LINPERPRIM_LOCUS33838 [Linum perenne]
MAKFWGISSEADIRALGDDLWLLCCSSEEEVERILSLKRWELPGYRFRADRWLPRAGTSNVSENRGLSWVKVKGIPLHLRSEAVMRDIAKLLGNQSVFDYWGCSLNEVRVRVNRRFPPPKGIRLCFREDIYWLPVVQEEAGEKLGRHEENFELEWPDASRKIRDLGVGGGVVKEFRLAGDVFSPSGAGNFAGRTPDNTLFAEAGEGGVGGDVFEKTRGRSDLLMVTSQEEQTTGHALRYDVAEEQGVDSSKNEKVGGDVGSKVADLGLKDCEALLASFGYGPSLGHLIDGPLQVGPKGARSSSLGPVEKGCGPQLILAQSHVDSQDGCCKELGSYYSSPGGDNRQGGVEKFPKKNERVEVREEAVASVAVGDVALLTSEKEIESAVVSPGEKAVEEGKARTCIGTVLSGETEAADSAKEDELSLQVAHILGLSLPDDTGSVKQAVLETARGVYSRRKKSKLEREMRHMDCETSDSALDRGKRGSGYVVHCLSLDEST